MASLPYPSKNTRSATEKASFAYYLACCSAQEIPFQTLQLVQTRSSQTHTEGSVLCLETIFSFPYIPPSSSVWKKLCDHSIAYHAAMANRFSRQVTHGVRTDDKIFYDSLAQQQGAIAADEGLPSFWKSIKPLLPKSRKKQRSNIRCTGPEPSELCNHYNQLEAGLPCDYSSLLLQCFHRQKQAVVDAPLQMALTDLPSRQEVERAGHRQKKGRAPGVDGVPAEVVHRALPHTSDVLAMLFLKAWILGSEPVQFKGGLMHSIAKKSGATTASGMRGIVLLDSAGKLYHSILRNRLIQSVPSLPSQLGGYRGQQTLFATQLLRSHCVVTSRCHLSTATVFVDVRSAFHCLLREHAFGTRDNFPPRLLAILQSEDLEMFNLWQLQSRSMHLGFFSTLLLDLHERCRMPTKTPGTSYPTQIHVLPLQEAPGQALRWPTLLSTSSWVICCKRLRRSSENMILCQEFGTSCSCHHLLLLGWTMLPFRFLQRKPANSTPPLRISCHVSERFLNLSGCDSTWQQRKQKWCVSIVDATVLNYVSTDLSNVSVSFRSLMEHHYVQSRPMSTLVLCLRNQPLCRRRSILELAKPRPLTGKWRNPFLAIDTSQYVRACSSWSLWLFLSFCMAVALGLCLQNGNSRRSITSLSHGSAKLPMMVSGVLTALRIGNSKPVGREFRWDCGLPNTGSCMRSSLFDLLLNWCLTTSRRRMTFVRNPGFKPSCLLSIGLSLVQSLRLETLLMRRHLRCLTQIRRPSLHGWFNINPVELLPCVVLLLATCKRNTWLRWCTQDTKNYLIYVQSSLSSSLCQTTLPGTCQAMLTSLATSALEHFHLFRPDRLIIGSIMVTSRWSENLFMARFALPAGNATGRHNGCSNTYVTADAMVPTDVLLNFSNSSSLWQHLLQLRFRRRYNITTGCLVVSHLDLTVDLTIPFGSAEFINSLWTGDMNGRPLDSLLPLINRCMTEFAWSWPRQLQHGLRRCMKGILALSLTATSKSFGCRRSEGQTTMMNKCYGRLWSGGWRSSTRFSLLWTVKTLNVNWRAYSLVSLSVFRSIRLWIGSGSSWTGFTTNQSRCSRKSQMRLLIPVSVDLVNPFQTVSNNNLNSWPLS